MTPNIDNTLDMMPISHFYDEKTGRMVCFADDIKEIIKYRDKEVVKYTLEQAAESRAIEIFDKTWYAYSFEPGTKFLDRVNIKLSKQSILSLESQIIKDLSRC